MEFRSAFLVLFGVANLCRTISGETFPQCENLESGAFVGGTSGCKSYIYCDGEDSYEGMCPSQLLFNTKDGSCAPPSDVDCDDNQAPGAPTTTPTQSTTTMRTTTTTTTTTTTPPPPPPTTTTTKATTIKTSTTQQATTKKIATSTTLTAKPSWITSPEVPAIDQSPTDSVEENPEESAVVPTESEESFIVADTTTKGPRTTLPADVIVASTSRPSASCPEIDRPNEVVFLPSEVSCNEYFVCYHGTPMTMSCSGQLYFDYISSKCELPERANCLILNTSTPNPRKQCTINTFDYFPYPNNCNYFYKCMNGFLSLQQCPMGFGWSDDMKLCVKLADGRCPMGRLEQKFRY